MGAAFHSEGKEGRPGGQETPSARPSKGEVAVAGRCQLNSRRNGDTAQPPRPSQEEPRDPCEG